MSDEQKEKRVHFANWVSNYFTKEDTKKWLFPDEKMYDSIGVYNSQNDRLQAVSRQKADKRGDAGRNDVFDYVDLRERENKERYGGIDTIEVAIVLGVYSCFFDRIR